MGGRVYDQDEKPTTVEGNKSVAPPAPAGFVGELATQADEIATAAGVDKDAFLSVINALDKLGFVVTKRVETVATEKVN